MLLIQKKIQLHFDQFHLTERKSYWLATLKKAPSCADMIFCLNSQTTYVLQKPGFPENLFYVATYAKGLKGFLICYYILKIRFKEFNKL